MCRDAVSRHRSVPMLYVVSMQEKQVVSSRSTLAVLAFIGLSQSALAATIRVPQQYPSIQSAVDAAAPGDTILVAPGTYDENVTIQKSLKLRSSAGAITTIISGGGRGSPVALWGTREEKITVQGFTLTGGAWNPEAGLGYPHERGAGLYVDSVAEATIRDNVVIENQGCTGGGIAAFSSSVFILDNVIRENGPLESFCSPNGEGIRADSDPSLKSVLVVERNYVIENRGIGLNIRGFKEISVRGNAITDNGMNPENMPMGAGVFADMTGGVIADNYIARNVAYDAPGLFIVNYQDPARRFTVTGNRFIDNQSAGMTGAATMIAYRPSTIAFRNNFLVGSSGTEMFQCVGDGVVARHNVVINRGSGGSASNCGQ